MIHLMLVEDNIEVAAVFADLITSFYDGRGGAEVTLIYRANDAVYRANVDDWDLIIMDIGLTSVLTPPIAGMETPPPPPPDFDGCLTALAIRGLGGARGTVPIVAITGGLHPTDERLMESAKFKVVLRKPALPSDLHDAIEAHRRRTEEADDSSDQ